MNLLLTYSVVYNSYYKFFISIISIFYQQKIPTEYEAFIHSQILLSTSNKFLVYYPPVSVSSLIHIYHLSTLTPSWTFVKVSIYSTFTSDRMVT